MEQDFQAKHDHDTVELLGLRKEIDTHRFLDNDKDRQNKELKAEIASNYDAIRRADSDIFSLRHDISEKNANGLVCK